MRPDPRTMLPLKPEMLWLLLSLHDESRHGYALMQDVEERTGGAVRIQTGALYRFLHRMESDDLVREAPAPAGETDVRRRYYHITPYGLLVASAELERMRSIVVSGLEAGLLHARSGEAG